MKKKEIGYSGEDIGIKTISPVSLVLNPQIRLKGVFYGTQF